MNLLKECLCRGTAPVRVVSFAKEYLREQGFEELYYDTLFVAREEGRYFLSPFPDVLFAFTIGKAKARIQAARMSFAHVDQPCFKIKGKPAFKNMNCSQLNVEVYGGMMDHTWFDRPLAMAGTVILKGDNPFCPKEREYDSNRPIAIIPGIAIHMQTDANSGWKIDRQRELMPITGIAGSEWNENELEQFLASELQVEKSEILGFDLNLYNSDQPEICGIRKEILSAPRLDNLISVSALLSAIVQAERDNGVNLIGLFDHEEVGSLTKSGADSSLLKDVLCQIFSGLGCSGEMTRASIAKSLYLSVDGAHGAHPNYPDRCDTTTRAYLGNGVAVKVSGTQKYATDCYMKGILTGLAQKHGIALQEINDRNTIRGGMTLGPMIGSRLPMRGCDIGVPMLAMHSARETMALSDYESLCALLKAFFSEE